MALAALPILVLAGFVGRLHQPKASGTVFEKKKRIMGQEYERSPALGLLNLAWEYSEAAKKVAREPKLKNVSRFLACRSVELALKAFLRAKGWEESELRQIGHNLQAALREAEKAGLGESCPVERVFRTHLIILNTWYEKKDFEYPFVAPELRTVWTRRVMNTFIKGADNLRGRIQGFVVEQIK
jgi:HEPN domain-containing protein